MLWFFVTFIGGTLAGAAATVGICPACDGDGYAHEPAPRAWPPLSQAEMDRRLALVADLVEVQS